MLTKRLGTWWIKNVMETAIVTPGGLPNVSSTVIQHTRNLPRDVWCSSFLYCWGVSEEVAVIKTDIWRIDSEIHASRWIDINCTKTDPPPPPAYYRPGKHILRYSTQHSSCCYRSMRAKGESFAKYKKKEKDGVDECQRGYPLHAGTPKSRRIQRSFRNFGGGPGIV